MDTVGIQWPRQDAQQKRLSTRFLIRLSVLLSIDLASFTPGLYSFIPYKPIRTHYCRITRQSEQYSVLCTSLPVHKRRTRHTVLTPSSRLPNQPVKTCHEPCTSTKERHHAHFLVEQVPGGLTSGLSLWLAFWLLSLAVSGCPLLTGMPVECCEKVDGTVTSGFFFFFYIFIFPFPASHIHFVFLSLFLVSLLISSHLSHSSSHSSSHYAFTPSLIAGPRVSVFAPTSSHNFLSLDFLAATNHLNHLSIHPSTISTQLSATTC